MVFFAVRIIPEIDRHGWRGRGADQFPLLVNDRVSVFVKGFHLHGQVPALEFSGIDRPHGIAPGKTPVDVRPAGDGSQLEILLNLTINIFKSFNRKGRPR